MNDIVYNKTKNLLKKFKEQKKFYSVNPKMTE